MKIHIKTYGCQMNERDSEALAGMLTEAGHVMVDSEEAADVGAWKNRFLLAGT